MLYTILAGAKRHRIEPWAYVRELLMRLHADDQYLEEMLPDHWAAQHPESVLTYRLEESRTKAAITRDRRSRRRARQTLADIQASRSPATMRPPSATFPTRFGVESRGGAVAEAPFPPPAHRTGRADFPHPALGQGFSAYAHGEVRLRSLSRSSPTCW